MARVEGSGARTTGQESKANVPRRLTLAISDTDLSHQISIDLGRVWEVFPVGSETAQFRAGRHSLNQEWEVVLTGPRDRPSSALWPCLVRSLCPEGPSCLSLPKKILLTI